MDKYTHLQRYLNYLGIAFAVVTAISLCMDICELARSAAPFAFTLFRKGLAALGWCGIACTYFAVVRHGWGKPQR